VTQRTWCGGPGTGRLRSWVVLSLALVAFVMVSACASATTAATDATLPSASLSTSSATTDGTWAIVPMGHANVPFNIFWQVFFRSADGSSWTLVTPRGVADNGGLVMTSGAEDPVTVGFLPNQNLLFSPLALTSDKGSTWVPGAIPDALASEPDALAGSAGGDSYALVTAGGGGVLVATSSDPTTWRTLVSRRTLARTPAGLTCGIGRLTAVSVDSSGAPLIATTCHHNGVVGVFAEHHGRWALVGPHVPGASTGDVLRLVDSGSAVSGLLALDTGGRTTIVAAWSGDGTGRWTRSPALVIGSSDHSVSTATGEDGEFLVVAPTSDGAAKLWALAGPAAPWRELRAPPAGTKTVVTGPDGEVEALSVNGSRLTEWVLATASGPWTRGQKITAPIVYGSSN